MCFIIDILSFNQKSNCESNELNLCLYGNVNIQIGNETLISNNDSEWVLAIAVYRLLHSLYDNHISGNGYPLIPCCGFFIISAQSNKQVNVSGCVSGFDWTVLHYGDRVKLITENDTILWLSYEEYKRVVIEFSDKVQEVFDSLFSNFNKIDYDVNYQISHYKAFRNEWRILREKADYYVPENDGDIDFTKCEHFFGDDIVKISKTGIVYRNMDGHRFIDFEKCAENYSKLGKSRVKNCIAEYESGKSMHEYIFYTYPNITKISFCKGLKNLFKLNKNNSLNNFKIQINNSGWKFYDKI